MSKQSDTYLAAVTSTLKKMGWDAAEAFQAAHMDNREAVEAAFKSKVSVDEMAKKIAEGTGADTTLPPLPGGQPAQPDGSVIADPALSQTPDPTKAAEADLAEFFKGQGLDIGALADDGESEQELGISGFVRNLFSVGAGPDQSAISEQLSEVFSKSPQEVLALQRNLIAGGYISKKVAKTLDPGWYDGTVAKAYAALLIDAQTRGLDPRTALLQRMALAGNLSKSVLDAEGLTPEGHMKELQETYVTTWGRKPPPGYVEKFSELNPEEFGFAERQKEAWDESPMAGAQRTQLRSDLDRWIKGEDL